MAKTKNKKVTRLRQGFGEAGKKKDKGETAEYVRNLVELHKVQGAVLRRLEKSLDG